MSICGVLLTEQGLNELGKAIKPYLKVRMIGKYIYCTQAVQNGNFLDMTFEQSQTDGSIKDSMLVSIPVHFVKFMATGAKSLPIGFSSKCESN